MKKLGRFIRLALLGVLATLVVLVYPVYTLLALASLFALLVIVQQLNFYKIIVMLKRFIRNARRLYFENRLKFRTGIRNYRDTELENSSRRCL